MSIISIFPTVAEAYGDFGPIAKIKQFWHSKLLKTLAEEELIVNDTRADFEPVPADKRPALSVRKLWRVFSPEKRGGPAVKAVRGLDLDLYSGEITCLLGPNGAGKSTFLGMLMGLLQPTAGNITLFDKVFDF